jgi:hypothetical protein
VPLGSVTHGRSQRPARHRDRRGCGVLLITRHGTRLRPVPRSKPAGLSGLTHLSVHVPRNAPDDPRLPRARFGNTLKTTRERAELLIKPPSRGQRGDQGEMVDSDRDHQPLIDALTSRYRV